MDSTTLKMAQNDKPMIKKAIFLTGNACYVGIPPAIVKEMQIDNLTFFEVQADNGSLLLKPKRLTP